jgi:hypothetical protein
MVTFQAGDLIRRQGEQFTRFRIRYKNFRQLIDITWEIEVKSEG